MTDEELKELANLECAKLLKSEKGYNGLSYQEFWAEGMKYGLEEGKPKWHDWKENPNDLPKENGEYWCKWEDGSYSTGHYFQDYGFGDYVVAWCELPKFEE